MAKYLFFLVWMVLAALIFRSYPSARTLDRRLKRSTRNLSLVLGAMGLV